VRKRIQRPSPALVVACIALFVALGGVGYAAATINGADIKNKTIAGKKLKNKTVTGGKVKNNTLTGTQVNESKLSKVPSAANADRATSAGTADNAARLDGLAAGSLRTASAAATLAANVPLTNGDQTILQTTITLPSALTVMATATIDATADNGTDDDNMNCNLKIGTVEGERLSTNIVETPGDDFGPQAGLAATQSLALGAGTHTVLLECGEGSGSNTTITDGALTVWATS